MKNMSKVLALILLASASAWAQEKELVKVYRAGGDWVQETTGAVPSGRYLKVYSGVGSVEVRGNANQRNITYTVKKILRRGSEEAAKKEWAAFAISNGRKGEWVWINGDWPAGRSRQSRLNVEYQITLPKDTDAVKVETQGGSVNVYTIKGKVYATTAGGSISGDDIGDSFAANTMGGSIEVGHIGGEVNLNTEGGSIRIGSVVGRIVVATSGGSIDIGKGGQGIKAETAGGSIVIKVCNGELHASTAGGSIEIGEVGAGARLETAGGGIRLISAKGNVRAESAGGGIRLAGLTSGVQAETASGPIEAEFISTKVNFTESHLATTGGDIIVYLPSDLPVTIKAAIELANGHDIITEFNGIRVSSEGGKWGPKEVFAEGNLNGGGPVLKVHTANGNIYFRKTKSK